MDTLGKALAQIASQLGVAVNHLWPQIVAVTFYESLAWVILDPVLLIVGTVLAVKWWKMALHGYRTAGTYKNTWGETVTDNGGWVVLMLVLAIGYGTLFCLVVTSYPSQIAGVLSPEGVTAVRLLSQLTGK